MYDILHIIYRWACTWLSQWHPLTYPQYTPEQYKGIEFNGTYEACNNTLSTVEAIYWLGTGECVGSEDACHLMEE